MKTLIQLFVLLAFVAGCTDLDVDIRSRYTQFPDSEMAIEAKAANAYFAFRAPLGRMYNTAQTLSSDEAMGYSLGTDYWDNGQYAQLHWHSYNASTGTIQWWSDLSRGIVTCNELITEMGGSEVDATAKFRAARAFYFWVLMDNYGAVPLLDHLLEAEEAIDRSPRPVIARFIESELLAVMDLLPTTVDITTYGKPTRWMAQALLAKLYINWAVYTCENVANYTPAMPNEKLNAAIAACDDIIASGIFNLSDDYMSKFNPENGVHIKDFIYAMPFDRVTQQGMSYARFWSHRNAQANIVNGVTQVGLYGVILPSSTGGNLAMLPEFVDKFNLPGDDRNEQILGGPLFIRDPNTYKATTNPWIIPGADDTGANVTKQVTLSKEIELDSYATLMVSNNPHGGRSKGYRSIKFYMDVKRTAAHGANQSNDVPIFRFADILLMKAEAILRGANATNGDTPLTLMNQIRSYVHAPLMTQNPTLDELLDERAREFADENWRRNDLIRFGMFEDDWGYKHIINPSAKTALYRRIFPVPQTVLNTNTNWSQNPGY